MEGKWVILIVLIVTIIGIALAYFFLQAIPNKLEEQSLSIQTIFPASEWLKTTWHIK
ncbi:hypothetical protein KQI49_17775 [Virgibacillus sp. MSJ-26]|uniref:hypothetical protein n=1 Tax=Virgibacillus sp. MSJ-26 TaxID=2841522 RepID=UPI001C10930A|nr:hypothetical protein [Virgibacillus sp. MSJ-26]MBU5468662.1 hypothetical protein [Virgibacillus sp. MSJ-26]